LLILGSSQLRVGGSEHTWGREGSKLNMQTTTNGFAPYAKQGLVRDYGGPECGASPLLFLGLWVCL